MIKAKISFIILKEVANIEEAKELILNILHEGGDYTGSHVMIDDIESIEIV